MQDPRLATIRAQQAADSVASAASGGFGGRDFWAALAAAGVEADVRCCHPSAAVTVVASIDHTCTFICRLVSMTAHKRRYAAEQNEAPCSPEPT